MRIFAPANFEGAIVSLAIAVLVAMAPAPPAYADAKQEVALEYFQEGRELYKAGDFSGALDPFELSLRLDDSNPAAHYWYGKTLMRLGKTEAGNEHLRKARDLGPDTKAGIRAAVELEKMEENRQAAKESEIALLTPSTDIKPQNGETELNEENIENIENIVIEFYNNNRIFKLAKPDFEGYTHYVTRMVSISNMTFVRISKKLISADLRYRWEIPDFSFQRNGRGIATIEKTGSSYKVLKFETDGQTYISRTDEAELAARQTPAEVETALVAIPLPATTDINEDEIVSNPEIDRLLKDAYDRIGIYKKIYDEGEYRKYIKDIYDILVTRSSGDVVAVEIHFLWGLDGPSNDGTGRATATIKKVGSSYRVLKFETGGKTYTAPAE